MKKPSSDVQVRIEYNMGKVFSVINRQMNKFNAENRAHRVISKDKPKPAPKHPSTLKQMEKLISETYEYRNGMMAKNKQLDENLRKVYVVSQNVPTNLSKPSEKFRLPTNRSSVIQDELEFEDLENVPEGYASLKQIMTILADHEKDSDKYNVVYISGQYKLAEKDVLNLLKYFCSFKVHLPEKAVIERSKFKAFLKSSIFEEKEKKALDDKK